MAKWEAVTFGPGKEYVTLYCDGNDILDDAPIVTEIAHKLNAFDEILAALKEIQMLDDSGPAGLAWVELGKARNIASEAIAKAEAANV